MGEAIKKIPRIGIDLDNTIACYDDAIMILSEKLQGLPTDLPRTKKSLRNYLHQKERHDDWTSFQGLLYGPGMSYARAFDGAIEYMQKLQAAGYDLWIISHRSRYPYAGEKYDLQMAAEQWIKGELQSQGLFLGNKNSNCDEPRYQFHETKASKIESIMELEIDIFVDDLPEIISEAKMLGLECGILFDRGDQDVCIQSYNKAATWEEVYRIILSKYESES